MGRDCCRKARARLGSSGNRICEELEATGTGRLVYPTKTATGEVKITLRMVVSGQTKRVELFSFLAANKCNGVIARWILAQKERIENAVYANPQRFASYASTGIALNQLSTLCRGS